MSKDEKKKAEELACFEKFKNTTIGSDWCSKNAIVKIISSEHPDFLFHTQNGKIIGIELANITPENENKKFTQTLMRTGNYICEYVRQKHSIDISMIIDKFDKDMWCRKDFSDTFRKIGFSELPSSKGVKELKKKIKEFFDTHIDELKKWPPLIRTWIEIEGNYFKISATTNNPLIGPSCHVNNALRIIEDPIGLVQKVISDKNEKLNSYFKQCQECSLLLFVPYFKLGSVCSLTPKLLDHKFEAKFKEVFLYDEKHNIAHLLKT